MLIWCILCKECIKIIENLCLSFFVLSLLTHRRIPKCSLISSFYFRYIYTDAINLQSFDQACELCYVAKKYMLPHLVGECTNYLWQDLFPKNACRAYEFAKLFEEPVLMDKCLQVSMNVLCWQ